MRSLLYQIVTLYVYIYLQLFTLNSKYQTKENETSNLRKENEHLKKELKSANLNLYSAEAKTTKANEEVENLKATLKIAKQEEKVFFFNLLNSKKC